MCNRPSKAPIYSASTLLVLIFWVQICVFSMIFSTSTQGQTIPYSPERLAMLESKLKKVESQQERATLLLDIYDQIKSIDPNKANACTDEALKIAQSLKNNLLIARAYCNEGIQQFMLNNNEESYRFFVRALALIDLKKDTAIMVRCYQNMGVLYRDYGNYYKAIEFKYRALNLCSSETKWLDTKCQLRYNLSLDYTSVGQLDKSEYLLKENLKDLKLIEAPQRQAQTMTALSEVMQLKGNNQKSYQYAFDALQITKRYGFFQNTLNNYIFLGQSSEALGRKEDCLKYARLAQHLADSIANIFSQASVYNLFALYYFKNNQLDSSNFYVLRAITKLEERKLEVLFPDPYHLYSSNLRKEGKIQQAIVYEKKYHDLLEIARNQEIQNFSLNNINAYAISKSYEKINQRYSNQLQQENKLRTLGLAGLILALIVGIGIFLLYRQEWVFYKQLQKKQVAILTQKEELQQLNTLKTELFGAIARDLREPLQKIQMVATNYKKTLSIEQEAEILAQLKLQTEYTNKRLEEMLEHAKKQMNPKMVG